MTLESGADAQKGENKIKYNSISGQLGIIRRVPALTISCIMTSSISCLFILVIINI